MVHSYILQYTIYGIPVYGIYKYLCILYFLVLYILVPTVYISILLFIFIATTTGTKQYDN